MITSPYLGLFPLYFSSSFKIFLKKILFFFLYLKLFFLILIFLLKHLNPFTSGIIIYRNIQYSLGHQINTRIPIYKSDFYYLNKKNFDFILMLISSEDGKFFEHFGFDFDAIEKAIHHNKKNKKTRGASTITQQLAKNLFLWPQRNWIRKALETYFTILIEFILSKKRIIELYLNIIEWGPNIFGIYEASEYYFKKKPENLTLNEKLTLISIIPSPLKWGKNLSSSFLLKRKNQIYENYEKNNNFYQKYKKHF